MSHEASSGDLGSRWAFCFVFGMLQACCIPHKRLETEHNAIVSFPSECVENKKTVAMLVSTWAEGVRKWIETFGTQRC